MANSTAERLKIEWFHGISLYLESEEGQAFLDDFLGPVEIRDEVEFKTLLILIEAAMPKDDDWAAEELELCNWLSAHRSSARQTYLTGRFAREDYWDQRAWDTRYSELSESAKIIALAVLKLIEDKKAELEDDIAHERQTPIMPVAEEDLELCAKMPSSMVTMPLEDDPEAMERVERYIKELELDFDGQFVEAAENDAVEPSDPVTKKRTIYPPPSVPPGDPAGDVNVPRDTPPQILSKRAAGDKSAPHVTYSYVYEEDD
ncbi:hypothetical protein GF391_01865 [Candidatus Uhrbacteria bacterium]|nr:hypothetical protein [Candidatus Uhrbacteria bacterium]